MKAKHTPAPWTYVEGFLEQDKIVCDYWVRGADKDGICEIGRKHSHEAEANARLIASAPELLAALKELLHIMEQALEDTPAGSLAMENARQAIAKAEGA